jgi:Zn-dependent peptidase ImmA (M78 family)/transcriptional regulator with XRE-family HTH domain
MAPTLAYVTPEVLRWARESAGYAVEDAAAKINLKPERLQHAENGEGNLTLRQAERAAEVYERPLALFFLPEPPDEGPQEAQFRRLSGAPEPPWPTAMQFLARRVRERQEAATELHELLEQKPEWPAVAADLSALRRAVPEFARECLDVSLDEQQAWNDPTGYAGLRVWIDAVESLGVLVMQDGSMPVDMMRGFAAPHASVPLIVVNTNDDPRSRAFTVVHEFAHLNLAAIEAPQWADTEGWCESFAGEVLMPRNALETALGELRGHEPLEQIDKLALRFGVTPRAAAVRVAMYEFWPRSAIEAVMDQINKRPHRERGSGGDYYRREIARLGPSYIRLVFSALDGQAITYPAASLLLDGVRVPKFDKLREYIAARPERG